MKTVMKFLSLLLCFELVMGPVQGSLLLPSNAFAQKDCPVGQAYNASVNRCLTKAEVLKVNEATNSCGNDRSCYKSNAEKALTDQGGSFDNDSFHSADGRKEKGGIVALNAVAMAIPLVIVTGVLVEKAQDKNFKCKPASLMLMYGAAAALAAGEIYGFFNHKTKLDEIQDEWNKTIVHKEGGNSDSKKVEATEAQSQAFEFLAKNEDQVAKVAKTKHGFYLAAAGLFAAGALMAGFEQIQLGINRAKLVNVLPNGMPNVADDADAHEKIRRLTCSTDEKSADYNAEKAQNDAEIKELNKTQPLTKDQTDRLKTLEDRNAKLKTLQDARPVPKAKPTKVPPTKPASTVPPLLQGSIQKLKRVAAYNISTAKDAEQLVQLIEEMNSIELQNYSQISYYQENEVKELKKFSLIPEISQVIAGTFISSAHAQDTACPGIPGTDEATTEAASEAPAEDKTGKLLSMASMALPLVMGLKQITGGIKSKGGTPISSAELNQVTGQTKNWVVRAVGKPVTRLAINGVLGTWMGVMASHMTKQQELSEERAVMLRKMKDEFVSANGLINCSPADRDNMCKPKCFCFTPENKFNTARSNQKICSNALAKMKADPFGKNENDKICVGQDMKVDPTCACRAKRSCLKISSGLSMKGFSPGVFKMVSAGGAPAQDLLNGNIAGGDIADSAGINAARIKAAADAMLSKADPAAMKEQSAFASGLEKGLLASAAGYSMGGGSSALPSSPAAAAAALDKELKENKESEITKSGGGNSPTASFDSDEEVPDMGLSDQASEEIEIAEIMTQELDMGNNDINTGSSTNIFDVLSNRYKRSGMRRLFDEKGQTPADAPDKKEIAE